MPFVFSTEYRLQAIVEEQAKYKEVRQLHQQRSATVGARPNFTPENWVVPHFPGLPGRRMNRDRTGASSHRWYRLRSVLVAGLLHQTLICCRRRLRITYYFVRVSDFYSARLPFRCHPCRQSVARWPQLALDDWFTAWVPLSQAGHADGV